jgi:hypothetical protein
VQIAILGGLAGVLIVGGLGLLASRAERQYQARRLDLINRKLQQRANQSQEQGDGDER